MRLPSGANLLRACLLLGLIALLAACEGKSPGLERPQPRSRQAAGEAEDLPFEAKVGSREPVDTSGGTVEYRHCRLDIPRGALTEPIFIEIQIPSEPPGDVFSDSAYQINPNNFELERDAVLTMSYFDEDIPAGKEETDVVVIRRVNNVWVELPNTEVRPYNNTVQVPVRFLGLYALRTRTEDPRIFNTAPEASFEYSFEPFPASTGEPAPEEARVTEGTAEEPEDAAPGGPVDINSATLADLLAINGVTETLALRIIDYRESNGGFDNIEQLKEIEGISAKLYQQIKSALDIGAQEAPAGEEEPQVPTSSGEQAENGDGRSPFNWNRSDAGFAGEKRFVAAPVEAPASSAGNVAETGETPTPSRQMDDAAPDIRVFFDASASHDPDGTIVQYDWDFDADGIFDYTSHNSPYAEHVFKYNGDYSVVLKVTDNGSYPQHGFGTGVVEIRSTEMEPRPLSANISAWPATGEAPLTINLAGTVTGGTPPYRHKWTFTDGSASNLPNPHVTYANGGERELAYTVTDVKGEELSGPLNVRVRDREPLTPPAKQLRVEVSPYTDRGTAPYTAKFSLKAVNATKPVTYRITFGDEADPTQETVTSDDFITHYYSNAGFYLVKIVATDAELKTDTTFATVHCLPPDFEREFTISSSDIGADPFSFGHDMQLGYDYAVAKPRTVRFHAVNEPEDSPLAYHWDFGDGTYSTEEKPEHTFAADGVYEVRLEVSGTVERWRQRLWLPVSTVEPAAAIQRPAYLEGPAPLRLELESIVTRGDQPFRYHCEIDDRTYVDAGIFHVFDQPGEYRINLTVYDKYDVPIETPPVEVRVRPGPVDYRLPVALTEPLSGSNRATVIDYNAANPLPLSSPHAEGPVRLVDLSPDGLRLVIVSREGLLLKRISSGQPLLQFLPAGGELNAVHALDGAAVLATVNTATGTETYLLRPGREPVLIASGTLLSASGDGSMLVVGPEPDAGEHTTRLISIDPGAGTVRTVEALPVHNGVRLTADGAYLLYIDASMQLVRRALRDGSEEFLSRGGDEKSQLAISADGRAVAYVSEVAGEQDIIYGRYVPGGEFKLASLTDLTGFYSEYFALGAAGQHFFAYGSRSVLEKLKAESGATAEATEETESEVPAEVVDGEAEPESYAVKPGIPARRERFGVIRMDLSGAPDTWRINTVRARFIYESSAEFAIAGPFVH